MFQVFYLDGEAGEAGLVGRPCGFLKGVLGARRAVWIVLECGPIALSTAMQILYTCIMIFYYLYAS